MLVTPDWVRLMARYNAWQNAGLIELARGLPEAEAARDRGAFWGSILGTLSHLAWGDAVWMHRLAGRPHPGVALADSARMCATLTDWTERRRVLDADLTAWAEALAEGDLKGDVTWDSPAAGRRLTRARDVLVTHMFNHQAHHRGQVHAMLTAAGLRPQATDLPFMPV